MKLKKNEIAAVIFSVLVFTITISGVLTENIFDALVVGGAVILLFYYDIKAVFLLLTAAFVAKIIGIDHDKRHLIEDGVIYLIYLAMFFYLGELIRKGKKKISQHYSMVENISVGLAILDENLKYIYCNKRYAKLKGVSKDEINGRYFSDFYYKIEEQGEVYEWMVENIKNKHEWTGEIVSFCKEKNREFWEELLLFPVMESRENERYIVVSRDNSLRVEAEKKIVELKREAVNASMEKSRFLANMSHDIRTPINGIIGFTELLLDCETDKEKIKMLSIVRNSSDMLLQLINDILDISKIEAGKLRIIYENFNLMEYIENILEKFELPIEMKGIQFERRIDGKLAGKIIKSDRLRLEQIIMNLLSNAMKFTEKGKIVFRMLQISEEKDKIGVRFEIEDSGIGISEEKIDKIFMDYEQGEDAIYRKYGGTGLGLTIVKKIVEKMSGKIFVDSGLNSGSKFSFEMEFEKGEHLEESEENAKKKMESRNFELLVIDDDVNISYLFEKIFYSNDVKVKYASTVEDAMEKVKKADIVVTDISMAKINGINIMRKLKKSGYEGRIIAYTSYAMKEDREYFIRAGFDDYIARPSNKNEIIEIVLKNIEKNEKRS